MTPDPKAPRPNAARGAANKLLAVIADFLAPGATPDAIRLEILLLGSRHRGLPLDGARGELRKAGLSPARARLLRAVVRQLS